MTAAYEWTVLAELPDIRSNTERPNAMLFEMSYGSQNVRVF